jgi:hypothetical protein
MIRKFRSQIRLFNGDCRRYPGADRYRLGWAVSPAVVAHAVAGREQEHYSKAARGRLGKIKTPCIIGFSDLSFLF